jgi:uncharacterized protein
VPVDEVSGRSRRPWGPGWLQAVITAIGASFGGWAGAVMLRRVNEKLLKLAVVALGVALTIGLFWTAP